MLENDLKHKAVIGIIWSYTSTFTNALFQLAFAGVMARLLTPETFGIFAMAQVVLNFGQYFSQMGIGAALVQKPELSQRDIRTAWTLVIFTSSLVFGIIWIAAPSGGLFFRNIEVTAIVRVAAFSLILQGLVSVPLSLLRRNMDFRKYTIIELISYIFGYGTVGVISAYFGMGVWALVMAQLGQNTLQLLIVCLLARTPLSFGWEKESAIKIFHFGGKVSVISFLEFISGNLDTILAGRYLTAESVGYYNRGKVLTSLPLYYATSSMGRVFLPLFARLNADKEKQQLIFKRAFTLLSTFLISAATAIALFAVPIVRVLLGPNWEASVPIVQVCAFAVAIDLLSNPMASLCEAKALLNIKIIIQFARIGLILFSFLLLKNIGPIGIAWAILSGHALAFVLYCNAVQRTFSLWELIISLYPGIFVASASSIVTYVTGYMLSFPQYGNWIAKAIIFFLAFVACFFSPIFRSIRGEFYQVMYHIGWRKPKAMA